MIKIYKFISRYVNSLYNIIEELLYPNRKLTNIVFMFVASIFSYFPLVFFNDPSFFMNFLYWFVYLSIIDICKPVKFEYKNKNITKIIAFFSGIIIPIIFTIINAIHNVKF